MSMEGLYRRIQTGKRVRYEPVGMDWTYQVMPIGSTLVTVCETEHGTMTSTICNVEPDRATVLAAIREFEGYLCEVLRNEYRSKAQGPMTKRQRAAWDRFEAESGISVMVLSGPDAWAAASKTAEFLKNKMETQ